MVNYHQLADLLLELEMTMRQACLWKMSQPSEQDLASKEPFCVDTMGFDQWLRFVMLERYKIIIEEQLPLPTNSNIRPMAEMFFKPLNNPHIKPILSVLGKLDDLINGFS